MKPVYSSLRQITLATSFTLLLASCGGGGGGGVQSDANTLLSGVLLDSAVSGVKYDDALTGLDGRYFYHAGDDLRFHLGGIELGTVSGRAQTTPFDLAGSHDDYRYDRAIRTARLLQSLDANGVLSDGIQISDIARNTADLNSLDWTLDAAAFERAASDLVFTLTVGQGLLVTADSALLHLKETLNNTVEACSALPRNASVFQINNPRCLDKARMASWLETVKPREIALDSAVESLAAGGDATAVLDGLVALVPAGTTGLDEAQLEALANWVAERVAGDNSALRSRLGEFLGIRYVSRVHSETPCTEPCTQPTVGSVVSALQAMQNTAAQTQWQRALTEARVARQVAETWLAYGHDRSALMAVYGISSLRDRSPLLRGAAATVGAAADGYRVGVTDAWVADQLSLNDTALKNRGAFDTSSGLQGDSTDGPRVSGVAYDNLTLNSTVDFTVSGSQLGTSLVLSLDGCAAVLQGGGDTANRTFRCTLSGESGWRSLVISDGLDGSVLYRLSVFVSAPAGDGPSDDSGNDDTGNDNTGNDDTDDDNTGNDDTGDNGPIGDEPAAFSVTRVSPTSAAIGQQTTFTVAGTGFNSAASVAMNGCLSLQLVSQTATALRFSCTPSGQSGNRAVVVSQGALSNNSLRVRFDAASATISSVTPTAATAGVETTFTVSGANLSTALSYTLENCSALSVLAGATATSQQFSCTPTTAGAAAGSVLDGATTVHTFSVSVAAAVVPSVTSVSPDTGGMSVPLELTVRGKNLPDGLSLQLAGCTGINTVSNTTTEHVFSCQPSEAGTLNGTVSADGVTLKSFSVDISDDRITVSEVRPGATRLGAITTFTVSGQSLPTTLTLDIENCDDLQSLGGTTVRRQFRCTPTGALGVRDVNVMFDANSTTPIFTHTLTVAGDGPLVTNVSPTLATVGRAVTFTVVGQSLPTNLSFRMAGCSVTPVGTGTASVHRYRCTVSGVAGTREATVTDSQSGTVLYTFNVSVNSAT